MRLKQHGMARASALAAVAVAGLVVGCGSSTPSAFKAGWDSAKVSENAKDLEKKGYSHAVSTCAADKVAEAVTAKEAKEDSDAVSSLAQEHGEELAKRVIKECGGGETPNTGSGLVEERERDEKARNAPETSTEPSGEEPSGEEP